MLKLNRCLLAVPFVLFVSVSINALTLSTAWAVSDEVAVQLLERLSELEQEVSNLRGENETLRRELITVRSMQRTGFLEVDRRINGLEKRRSSAQTAAANVSNQIANNSTTNNPARQQNSAVSNNSINNTVPALEDPLAVAAALPTPGTIVARPSPITLTPAAPAIEVTASANSAQTSPQLNSETIEMAAAQQRMAVVPVGAGQTASTDAVDPGSPESYYYYGTEDKNATPAIEGGIAGINAGTDNASLATSTLRAIPAAHKAKAAYNQAYKLLVNEPASAIPAFRAFMSDHPQHELVANAQYWLGEALYAQQDYSGATEEFMQVLKNHKSSPKAPGAALKLGYSFYELRQWDFARRTLEDTVRFFPETNAAKLAANRLERMKAEGR